MKNRKWPRAGLNGVSALQLGLTVGLSRCSSSGRESGVATSLCQLPRAVHAAPVVMIRQRQMPRRLLALSWFAPRNDQRVQRQQSACLLRSTH